MKALLYFLYHGHWPCSHSWDILKEQPMVDRAQDPVTREWFEAKNYTRYTLRCPKCGEIKTVDS